jgi:hypothetical protein
MRRVLIVSPHFPPANGADVHRVRVTIPYFRQFGFEPEVLAVDPKCLGVPMDPWLEQGVPAGIKVHRCSALSLDWGKIPGLGTLAYRAKYQMQRLGAKLLSASKFDLVYFSTTVFGLCPLGIQWKKLFGVPYIVDYQDPWVSDYYQINAGLTPPGGKLKFGIVQWLARREEPKVIQHCSGITSVSPAYPQQLTRYYPQFTQNKPTLVAPFPGAARDLERVHDSAIHQNCFSEDDGLNHWVYIGRGGDDMAQAVRGFFLALRNWKSSNPAQYSRTRIHFIGTSYALTGQGTQSIQPIADRLGVGDIVEESTDRIKYSSMLRCLLDADALIVPGSNDPGYTASKLYPYLLTRKPMLAIFAETSSVVDVIRRVGGAQLVTFNEHTNDEQLSNSVYESWFNGNRFEKSCELDEVAFEPFTDRGSAKQLCDFFQSVIDNG